MQQQQQQQQQQLLFYSCLDFVQDYPDEPVPEETFTHSHLSWSSIILYLLPPSTAIHSILRVQSFCTTSVQVFFGQPLRLAPFTSYSIHFFTQSLSFFAMHTHTTATCFAVVPRLYRLMLVSLSTLGTQYCHTSIWPFSSLPAEVPHHYARQRSYSAYMPWQFRLSLRLSVTRVDQPKTVEARITQFSPHSSPIPVVFRG